jgi:hypothetical protein
MAAHDSPPMPLPTTITSYSSAGDADDTLLEVAVEIVVDDEGVVDVYS